MKNDKSLVFFKRIFVTFLITLGAAGVVYFFEAIMYFNSTKSDQILWILLFGISFSYIINYKLDAFSRFNKNLKPK